MRWDLAETRNYNTQICANWWYEVLTVGSCIVVPSCCYGEVMSELQGAGESKKYSQSNSPSRRCRAGKKEANQRTHQTEKQKIKQILHGVDARKPPVVDLKCVPKQSIPFLAQ